MDYQDSVNYQTSLTNVDACIDELKRYIRDHLLKIIKVKISQTENLLMIFFYMEDSETSITIKQFSYSFEICKNSILPIDQQLFIVGDLKHDILTAIWNKIQNYGFIDFHKYGNTIFSQENFSFIRIDQIEAISIDQDHEPIFSFIIDVVSVYDTESYDIESKYYKKIKKIYNNLDMMKLQYKLKRASLETSEDG